MQHKSLFAAMMVGALVLASCVKNQESQSVTDVRNARADEIKSQAELNRANAQAAVTLAKAQETIAAAQAKLLEAQAAIAEAEAAKISVEAELAAVEVEIAKVKLEEERVKLQAKKAELEALKAKYEAEIAQAEAQKQEAINRLARAAYQAELDELAHQKALIDAEAEMFKAIASLEDAQRKRIARLFIAYSNATKEVYTNQAELLKKEVELARIQAHLESGLDYTYNQIVEKQEQITMLQRTLSSLEAIAEAAYEDLYEVIEKIYPSYVAAASAMEEAQLLYVNAWNFWQNRFEDPTSELYIQPEFTYNWDPVVDGDGKVLFFQKDFQSFMFSALGDDLVFEFDIASGAKIWGYYDGNGDFVPLWKDEAKIYGDRYYYPEMEGVVPVAGDWFQDFQWSPAIIFYNNFNSWFESYNKTIQQWKDDYDEEYYEIPDTEEEIAEMEDWIASMREYVAKADVELIPAKTEMEEASKANNEAYEVYWAAYQEVNNYKPSTTSIEWVNYMKAYSIYNEALYNDGDVDWDIENYEKTVVPYYRANLTTAKANQFEADKAVLDQKAVVAEKEEAVTEAIVTAYTDAVTAVATAKAAVGTKFTEYQTALDDAYAKDLIYKADPNNADKKKAAEDAEKAAEDALKAYNEAVEAVAVKEGELTTAKEAYDAVKNPYDAAVATLEELEQTAAAKAAAVATAEESLQKAEAYLAEYEAQKLLTVEAVALAKANMEEAKAAYDALGTQDDPVFQELVEAYNAAYAIYREKSNAYWEARRVYYTILASYNGYDYWNWDYEDDAPYTYNYYVWNLDENNEYTDAYALIRMKEDLFVKKQNYASQQEWIDNIFSYVTDAQAEIEHYQTVAQPVYEEWLANRTSAEMSVDDAYKSYIDAVNDFYDIYVKIAALEEIIIYMDANYNEYNMEDLDKLITEKTALLAQYKEELAQLIELLEMGDYGMVNITKIQGEIAELEAKIEMYTALANSYWEELQDLMPVD